MTTPQNPAQQPMPQDPTQKPKKKGGCMKWGGIGVGAIILIAIGSSLAGGGDDNDTTAASSSVSAPAEAGADPGIVEEAAVDEVPTEYRSALKKAESYIRTMPMSKDGLYDQLTSEFDQFSPESAQYAVDTVEADWNELALKKAQSYQETMSMSPAAIYDQLVSQFEKFTPEQAQYAIDNL